MRGDGKQKLETGKEKRGKRQREMKREERGEWSEESG